MVLKGPVIIFVDFERQEDGLVLLDSEGSRATMLVNHVVPGDEVQVSDGKTVAEAKLTFDGGKMRARVAWGTARAARLNVEEGLSQAARHRGFGADIEDVCTKHFVNERELFGRVRTTELVEARVEFWKRLRAKGLSYPQIGRLVGRDHTTILLAIAPDEKREQKRLARNKTG